MKARNIREAKANGKIHDLATGLLSARSMMLLLDERFDGGSNFLLLLLLAEPEVYGALVHLFRGRSEAVLQRHDCFLL